MVDKAEELNINVKSQEGTVICFKLRKTTQLKKMIESYCNRNGVSHFFKLLIYYFHLSSLFFYISTTLSLSGLSMKEKGLRKLILQHL